MNLNDALPGFDPDVHRLYRSPLPVEEVETHGLRKTGDPESRKVVYRAVPHCDLFDLETKDGRDDYAKIMQMAADGKARIIDAQVKDHPVTGNFRALVHWADSVLLPPGTDQVLEPLKPTDEVPHAG